MFIHRAARDAVAAASDAGSAASLRRRHWRFLAALLASLVTLIVLPYLPTVSDSTYCRHSRLFWNSTDCVKYALHGTRADILLVGDSSLVFGIRPDVIERETGLSAYNLGLPAGAVLFYPRMLLDHYLALNGKPRLIVLCASPWTYVRKQNDLPHLWADALRFTLRHGSLEQIVELVSRDPRWLIQFPALVMQQEEWRHVDLSLKTWRQMNEEIDAGRGWLAYRNLSQYGRPVPTLPDDPELSAKPVGTPDQAMIERFRRTYERQGIRVAFYVSSIPISDPSYPQVIRAYSGLADNHPRTLPDRFFVDDGWRIHLVAAGTQPASLQMSRFIERFLRHSASPAGRDTAGR